MKSFFVLLAKCGSVQHSLKLPRHRPVEWLRSRLVVVLRLHLGLWSRLQTKMQWSGGGAQGMAHLMRVRFLPEPEVRVIPSRGPGSSGGPPGAGGKGGRGDNSGKDGPLEAGEKVLFCNFCNFVTVQFCNFNLWLRIIFMDWKKWLLFFLFFWGGDSLLSSVDLDQW